MEGNQVDLEGFVKRDAVAQRVRNGQAYMDITLVTKNDKGQHVFVDVVARNELCDQLEDFVEQGEILIVHGHLTWRSWINSSGAHTTRTVVMAEEIETLEDSDD